MPEELRKIIMIVAICVVGAALLAAAIYGAIRKFSRITWIGWQVLLVFGLSMLYGYLPSPDEPIVRFVMGLAYAVAAVALPLLLEYILRKVLVKRVAPNVGKPPLGHRIAGRIFGAISSMLAVVAFFYVLGGFGLAVTKVYAGGQLELPPWTDIITNYASDVILLSMLLIAMRAGLRLGLLKGLYMLIIVLLTFAAAVGSFAFYGGTEAGIAAGRTVGSWFHLTALAGDYIGRGVLSVLTFMGVEVIILLLAWFIGKGVQKVTSVRAIAAVDSLIVGIVYTAIFLVFVIGLYFGIQYAQANLGQTIEVAGYSVPIEFVRIAADGLSTAIKASPLSGALFVNNPLTSIIPAMMG